MAEHREALAELEKHGISLPDKVAGWVLLRRAGLSQEQKQLIQGRAPDYAQKAVTEAMYFLLGQDYKGKNADRSWRGKGYGSSNRWRGRQQGYITEDFYEAEDDNMVYDENFDDIEFDEPWDDAYYEDDEYEEQTYAANEEVDVSDETYWEAEQNYEDAFATYLDARRQMAHLKASRGFFPVVALTDGGGSTAGSPMSQGPRPPKAKGRGKSKSKTKSFEQDQHLGQQGRTDPTASQRHTLSQMSPSWTLGSPLPTELTFEVYDTAEPYLLSYLNISVEEGQGQRWICDDGARHGQTRTPRSTTPGPCWMVWTSRWRCKLSCL